MIITIGFIAIIIPIHSPFFRGGHDPFWGKVAVVAFFGVIAGVRTAIPVMVVSYPVWVAILRAMRSLGASTRLAACVASVPTLWCGVVVMPYVERLIQGDRLYDLGWLLTRPPTLILFAVTAIVGPFVAANVFKNGRDEPRTATGDGKH